ncbi:MAG: putative PEP-binding protein, partial [Spirulina sp.]
LPPALLRLIAQSVTIAHEKEIKVSLCGQLASIPEAIPTLLGLGIDELSINPQMIPQIIETISELSLKEAKESLTVNSF